MTRLFALVSYYDEPTENLERAVTDAIRIGCTHIIALDGAYAHYPHLDPNSPPECEQTIRRVCEQHSIPLTHERIAGASEPEKRTHLFNLAYQAGATRDDWLWVQDADHRIHHAQDIKPLLAKADGDVFNVFGIEGDTSRFTPDKIGRWVRLCFRAVPGLHVDPIAHWTYIDADGRVLWGYNSIKAAGDLPIVVHNRSHDRTGTRRDDRDAYYDKRADLELEANVYPTTCLHCTMPYTAPPINADITIGQRPDGHYSYTARRMLFLCTEHRAGQQAENSRQLLRQMKRLWALEPAIYPQVHEAITRMLADDNETRPLVV